MKVNNLLAHTGQPKPRNMNDNLYKSGVKGCSTCNLSQGNDNLYDAIDGWVRDDGNFTTIGHRRWIIYPPMKKTGFGNVGGYFAMYCFDKTFVETEYKNIAWPIRNMPIEFGLTESWSLSIGKKISDDIEVTLTNKKTGKIEKFSKKTKGKFHISNDNYGQVGCVIFSGPYKCKDGDSYRVDIKGKNIAVSYDVNFFKAECDHEKEILETIEPSCIKEGKKFYYCKECDYKIEQEIPIIPHDEEIIEEIKPTCTSKGKKKYICKFCFKKIDKILDIIPHNYKYNLLSERTGKTKGICQDCKKEINFNAPTKFQLWWKSSDSTESSYSSAIPKNNKINSIIYCWIDSINGDDNYRQFVIEVSDSNLLEIPEEINNGPDNELKVIGVGDVEITVYPKTNPQLKKTFNISLEN